jgi:serine/threonine protein kinase
MKLVEGETMADYLAACAAAGGEKARPPHDLPSRLERLLKVCDAVDYAHARGVVHRDLKPENVMLGPFNEVYVMDWGIAAVTAPGRTADGPDGEVVDASVGPAESGVLGTIGYMAPEQARSEPITPATDQYALGMMLAEIATLVAPRAGSTVQQIGKAISNAPPSLVSVTGDKTSGCRRSRRPSPRRRTRSTPGSRASSSSSKGSAPRRPSVCAPRRPTVPQLS